MRRYSRILKFLLIPTSCLIAWLMTEAVLYFVRPQPILMPSYMSFDPQMGMILAPGLHSKYYNGPFRYHYTHTAQGFRDAGPTAPGAPPLQTVLILGDSYTYGVYVEDDETFAALLQHQWRVMGKPIKVLNAAVPGTGTDYALRLLRTRLSTEQPKSILLFFHNSDFQDNQREEYMRAQGDQIVLAPLPEGLYKKTQFLRKSRLYNWLLSWSQVANMMKKQFFSIMRKKAGRLGSMQDMVESYDPRRSPHGYTICSDPANIALTEKMVEAVSLEAKRRHAYFEIFYVPNREMVTYFQSTGLLSEDELALRAIVRKHAIPFASLTPFFAASQKPMDAIYLPNETHWGTGGHRLVAEFVLQELARHPESKTP